MEHPPEYTIKQAAEVLDVSDDTVRRMIHDGRLRVRTVGRGTRRPTYRVCAADVDELRDDYRALETQPAAASLPRPAPYVPKILRPCKR